MWYFRYGEKYFSIFSKFDWSRFSENILFRKLSSLKMKKITSLIKLQKTNLTNDFILIVSATPSNIPHYDDAIIDCFQNLKNAFR